MKEQDTPGITAPELKFVWKQAKYTLFDHTSNPDILKELNTQSVLGTMLLYKQ